MKDLEIQEQAENPAKFFLKQKGIHPTEPIYWDLATTTISLDDLLDEYAKWMQEQDKWISVEDRLPNNDKEYIISNNLGNMFLAQYWEGNWIFDDYTFHNITHFMPLPSPPKTK